MSAKVNSLLKKIKKHWGNLWYAVFYMSNVSKAFIGITLISAILTSAYNIYNVYIIRIVIYNLQQKQMRQFFYILCFMFILSTCINIINSLLSHFFTPILNNSINKKIKWCIYDAYLKYNYTELCQPKFYDLYSYVLNNSFNSFFSMVSILGKMLSSIFSIIGISVLFSRYDTITLVIILLGVILSFLISSYIEKKKYLFNLDLVPAQREIAYIERVFYLPEYSSEVQLNKSKSIFYDYFENKNLCLVTIIKRWRKKFFCLNFFQSSVLTIMNILVIFKLGFEFFNDKLSLDVFAMLFNGTQQLFSLTFAFFSFFTQIYSASLNIEKFREFVNIKNKDVCVDKNNIKKINNIKLDNISFSYGNQKILHNISIEIGLPEDSIAIVGKNGSGKSTLLKIIVGLLKQDSGLICVNNLNINSIDQDSIRNRIAVVFQDPKIFSFSIAQNILLKYYIEKADEEKVADALKVVGLYEKISSLQDGIHTKISTEFDTDGVMLSGGELQKLSFARAYASNADVIIFDEPYNSLDTIAEIEIANIIEKLMKEKKVIIISHRLSLLKGVGKIYVLNNGEIVESGSLDGLIKQKGFFYMLMYSHQKPLST